MKFTKKEISDIKWYFKRIVGAMEIGKAYEKNNPMPEFIKINLIKYGVAAGRIIEIVKRRINYKDISKNENTDDLMKDLFGEDFFEWICSKHKKFIYGNNYRDNSHNIYDPDDD